jgi:hypothetical protein
MPSDLPILSAAGLFRPTSSSSASGVEGIAEVDDAIENEETVIETGEVTLDALIQAAETALATKTSTIVESGGSGGLGSTGGTYAARPAGVTGAVLYVGADNPTTSSAANIGAPALATDVWLAYGVAGSGGSTGLTAILPWAANTAYTANQLALSPSGALIQATTSFTSGSSYNAANWTVLSVRPNPVSIFSPGVKGLTGGFGNETAWNALTGPAMTALAQQMAGIGILWQRVDYQWTGGTVGATRNGPTDTVISAFLTAGINVVALFGDATNGVSATDGFCGAWMTSAVNHLAGLGVHVYEVQNEMNLAKNWGSGSGSSGQASASIYVNTLKAAYPVIHAADPQALVLHCGLAPYGEPAANGGTNGTNINPFDFFTQMYTAGAQGYFDAANFHCYSYPDLPAADDFYNTFFNLPTAYSTMTTHGDGAKQVWITEFGVATGTDAGYSSSNVATQATQALVVTQGYVMASRWPWAGPCLMFGWQDNTTDGDFGLLTSAGAQKTAYAAYAAILNGAGGTAVTAASIGAAAATDLAATNAAVAVLQAQVAALLGGTAPANTALPAITGSATVGSVLTATTGTWSNSPTSYAYQWARAGSSISGATSSTYTVASADLGKGITCTVAATNSAGTGYATSASTALVTSTVPIMAQSATGNAGTSATITLPNTTTAGNMLLLAVVVDSGATLTGIPSGWSTGAALQGTGSPLAGSALYFLPSSAAVAAGTTIATLGTGGSSITWTVAEFNMPGTTPTLDGSVAQYLNTGYNSVTSAGPATLTAPVAAANEALFAWGYLPSPSASGWTLIPSSQGHSLLWRPTVSADTTTAPSVTFTLASAASAAFDLLAIK